MVGKLVESLKTWSTGENSWQHLIQAMGIAIIAGLIGFMAVYFVFVSMSGG